MLPPPAPNFALLLLLPDAMRLNRWDALEERLAPLGCFVQGAAPVALNAATHAELYRHALTHETGAERLPTRWLLPELFTLDMGLAVLLGAREGGLLERLGRLKGSARRAGRDGMSLRASSPLAERGLSLLHVPDTCDEMERQASLLFGGLPFAALAAGPPRGPQRFSALRHLRGHCPPDRETSPFGLPLRLIRRAVAALTWHPCAPAWPAASQLFASIAQAEASGESLSGIAHGLEALSQAPLRNPRDADLLSAAIRLANPARLTMLDGPAIAEVFIRHGLYLDPWERQILSVFCAFPPADA